MAKRIGANQRKQMAEQRKAKPAVTKRKGKPTETKRAPRQLPKATAVLVKLALVIASVITAAMVGIPRAEEWARSSKLFTLREVEVETPPEISESEVRELIAVKPGVNLFEVQVDSIRSRLSVFPWAAKTRVIRKFPHKLRVKIVGRKAEGMVSLGGLYCYDQEGVLLPLIPGADPNVPLVYGLDDTLRNEDGALCLSESSLGGIRAFFERVGSVEKNLKNRISQVDLSKQDQISFMVHDLPTVLVIDREGDGTQIRRCTRLLAMLERKKQVVGSINFRHANLAFVQQAED